MGESGLIIQHMVQPAAMFRKVEISNKKLKKETKKTTTYDVVDRKIVFVFHVTNFKLETDHVDNPKGSHQCSRIK